MPSVEATHKFKNGDRVERINSNNSETCPVGTRGTVQENNSTYSSYVSVKWDNGSRAGLNSFDNLRLLTKDDELVGRHYGHPRFYELTKAEEVLHDKKNHDYAAGGDPLGNFKRVADILSMYPKLNLADPAVVAFVYALKQVDAYLWMKSNKHTAKVEGGAARLQDISVYAKLAAVIDEEAF